MAREIERKFLVTSDAWRAAADNRKHIVQAYIAVDNGTTVRVRVTDGRHAQVTAKFGVTVLTRDEFEYPVPLEDAKQMIEASRGRIIEKTRHLMRYGDFVWEIDVYAGKLSGLVIAEVEMRAESDAPPLPEWLGREVTGDPAWSNANLATRGMPVVAEP